MDDLYSVYWFDPEGGSYPELRFVSGEEAVAKAMSLVNRPAAMIGVIRRVLITNALDCCVWEWCNGFVIQPGEPH